MKALIYYGPKDVRIEERPMPKAEVSDVVVKVIYAGICGSDLTAYLHDGLSVGILMKGQYGHDGQFGHEMVGIVYEVGSQVMDVKVGDRVFINPTNCKRNGMLGCDIAGAFSEYVVVEDAAYQKNLFKLADDITFEQAVTIEPLCVATHGKNCIQIKPHENVVIYGAGTIGLCTLNTLIAIGCQRVVVVDVNQKRLEIVKEMGGTSFCPTTDGDFKEFLIKHFGSISNQFGHTKMNVDAYIDCAGAVPILNEIISLAKNNARVSIVAVYKEQVEFNMAEFLSSEMEIKGSCGYNASDVIEAFNNINMHRVQTEKIITHRFKHKDAVKAFEFAANPLSEKVKVVIEYE